ncbi:hypothetical protein D187_001438 [Cystobacter fuscus DSM 2262]|uniref:Uncharacterized protein n=1 Tax=Cystobacter fuscus (strain ATCC 25194 / DSM 2262 / NBRC 100088 / M29) TaxID=1242864 RepID=S9QHM9_CYSF2|nr:hypothetical protein [Cystobacter fuscus]EPX60789.1 hypothetical protein D187_001438 [Cystobacter fuscus DSM 2262]
MKKELVSFNDVVSDIPSLVELDDETLETVVGGYSSDDGSGEPSEGPSCNTLC